MVVFDLDGTLLRTDKTVSPRTIDTLRRCRAAGIRIAYATGRGSSADILVPHGLCDGKVTLNGATARVCDASDDTVVYSRRIPYMTARPFLLACHTRRLKMTSEADGTHYTNNTPPTGAWGNAIAHWQLTDFSTHNLDAEKLYSYDLTTEDVDFIVQALPTDLYCVMATDGVLMIMHCEATKSNAMAALAATWGIAPHEIVAFGDDLNDLDMLQYAGTGVAMGNASDTVKAAANAVCDTNDNDGAAQWLEDNLLCRTT
ncbi:MAG: HAD family hydrolase [Defluviitaleaceae bacterium]|nr:HAD family hydrolase [Defluviitaleaceae bacterium]